MFNGENRLDCAFQGHARMIRPRRGDVASFRRAELSASPLWRALTHLACKTISYGNRSDVDEADMIRYLSEDPQTRVIGLYVEGLGDGRKFLNTAKKVIKERGKPVIVFKNGRSARGAKQAVSIPDPFAARMQS